MSLRLENGTIPAGLDTSAHWRGVDIGEYRLSNEDFLELVLYVLENTDLLPDDQRLKFIERIKRVEIVDGRNKGQKRLQIPEAPVQAG